MSCTKENRSLANLSETFRVLTGTKLLSLQIEKKEKKNHLTYLLMGFSVPKRVKIRKIFFLFLVAFYHNVIFFALGVRHDTTADTDTQSHWHSHTHTHIHKHTHSYSHTLSYAHEHFFPPQSPRPGQNIHPPIHRQPLQKQKQWTLKFSSPPFFATGRDTNQES